MMDYDPTDWYWIVGGDRTKVFSSRAKDYVPASDITYINWQEDGGTPTRIASEAELGEVLAPYFIRPLSDGVLDGYREAQASKLTVETVAKVCFNHENRLRALEGRQPVNASQFKSAIKDLM